MTENYLKVLEESLERKLEIMAKIQECNLCQQEIFQAQDVNLEEFDKYVDQKGALIEELMSLDNGFETLYRNVEQELQNNRQKYAAEIKRLQELVTRVTEESVTIQAQEARNKKQVEDYFRKERSGIAQNRKNSKAAFDYYKSMSGSGYASSQFYDNKK
ncbi:MAG: flagellar protein FliT [Acetatifactor sp.]|nr:flagellar protein FliT [Acetatifactor sp.]